MSVDPVDLFEEAMQWLSDHYRDFRFYTERDIVWTVQSSLNDRIKAARLPYRVFDDYPMLPGQRADIVILENDTVEVAVEFKFEPSHARSGVDILPSKFPVVFWDKEGVGKDVRRVREFVSHGTARVGYSIFIDEGGYFRHRPAHPGSYWLDWKSPIADAGGIAVLWSKGVAMTDISDPT
jgi:hypothetical protein